MKVSNVKLNFIYTLAYQMLTFVLPLFLTPYLARTLGAESMGVYSYANSIASYFVLAAMLGLNNFGNREIAKTRDDLQKRAKTFWSIYSFQAFMAITVSCFYFFYCIYFAKEGIVNWILFLYVTSGLFDINWFFWGMEEFKITVSRNTVVKLSSVALIFFFVKSSLDLYKYVAIMAGSTLISTLVLWLYLPKRVIFYKPSFHEIARYIKPNIIMFIPVLAVSLYKIMDKIMLGALATYVEVGFYEYSEKVIAIPIACVNALGTVMLPRMSNLIARNQVSEEKRTIDKSMFFGTCLAVALSFGLMAIADVFVPFFYGDGYLKCIPLFYILLPSCIFLASANVIRTQYLIPHNEDSTYIISVFLGAVINLAANALLIPKLQSVGAAVGTFMAEASVCLYQLFVSRKHLSVKTYIEQSVYFVLCGLIMIVTVHFIPALSSSILTLAIKIMIGALVYLALILVKYKKELQNILGR